MKYWVSLKISREYRGKSVDDAIERVKTNLKKGKVGKKENERPVFVLTCLPQ